MSETLNVGGSGVTINRTVTSATVSYPLAPDGGPWANYLGHAIGRYTESEGGDSPETQNARVGLFDAYDAWVDAGRPARA